MAGENRAQVVVGIDGSPSSIAALRWALRYAAATGGEVRAIAAWVVPVSFGYPPVYDDVDWPEMAGTILDKAVAETVDAGVTVTPDVVYGHPANVLVEAGKTAELLVVGSRGHSTVTGMLLGSVSQHCVQHADCPVVVVRAPR